jgi:Ca2+-binding RTX toxin-like protein
MNDSSNIRGFYYCDSNGQESKYIGTLELAWAYSVSDASVVITNNPIKNWDNDLDGTGNNLANTITGNSGDNSLTGGAGNDTIYGGDGKDVIHGGADNDLIYGFLNKAGESESDYSGDTTANMLYGDAGNDTIWSGGGGHDYLDGGAGNDIIDMFDYKMYKKAA